MTTPAWQIELWEALAEWRCAATGSDATEAAKPVQAILDRLEERPATELELAKRELGAWLVAHPGWTFELGDGYGPAIDQWRCLLYRPNQGPLSDRVVGFSISEAAAVRDALARTKKGSDDVEE